MGTSGPRYGFVSRTTERVKTLHQVEATKVKMDNADLEQLSVSPGKLSPKFHPNTTEYKVTVGSDVKQIKVDPLTSDCGASYSIKGGDELKNVVLKEGEVTSIKVEVTAEDGSTIKNYFVHVTRLSASDASLSDIKLSSGQLSPIFDAKLTNYLANVSFHCDSFVIMPVAADKKTTIKVNDHDPKQVVPLNCGETRVVIEVTSPDQCNTQTYIVTVCREEIVRRIRFVDGKLNRKFECPVCLGLLYRPKSIANSSPKHVFCKSCIEELTRTSKVDPLDETTLKGDWKMDEFEMESDMASSEVHCVFAYLGCTKKVLLRSLGNHLKDCEFQIVQVEKSGELVPKKDLESKCKECTTPCPDCNRPVRSSELDIHKSYMCVTKHPDTVSHKVEVRQWEKKLRLETGEQSAEKLVKVAEEQLKLYYQSLPQHGSAGQYKGDTSPLRYLEMAAEGFSTAIKLKPKDGKFHFSRAQVLEEQFYCEDLYGIKPQRSNDFDDMDFNTKSKESSMEDDIQALCEMQGVGRNAPFAAQLKAIDKEYHHLLDQGQSEKADYVQKLYAWKSKQATQGGKTAQSASTEEGSLGKASIKYLDALSCGSDNYLYNFHVGRLMLVQHKAEDAVRRLNVAVGLKPIHLESRFVLGLALCKQKGGAAKRKAEALGYLSEGLELLLNQIVERRNQTKDNKERTELLSSSLLRPDSVLCIQGILTLANQLAGMHPPPQGIMSAFDVYHCGVYLATRVLSKLVARGDTYHQLEWSALEGKSSLLQMLMEENSEKSEEQSNVIKTYCDYLSALIKCSTVPPGPQLLDLQLKTCQQTVLLQPCNSQALYRLGNAQFCLYESDSASSEANGFLQEAELSFKASIEQEGKPCDSTVAPTQLGDQQWFKDRLAKKNTAKAKSATATQQKAGPAAGRGSAPSARGAAGSRGRGAPARGGTAGRGTTPSRGGTAAKPPSRSTGVRGKTSPVKGATSVRGTSRGSSTPAKGQQVTLKNAASNHKTGVCIHTAKSPVPSSQQAPAPIKSNEPKPSASDKPAGPPNKPTYQARLGLARVLARKGDDVDQCYSLYENVLTMAPDVHDAYIELADLLIKKEPMKAVDVYCRYPFPETLTFDDAYIHGEIVRILMKQQKYDDPRLGPSLIALGKVMGLTVIEKYVDTLDKTFKYSKLLREVYAGVNGKDVEDPDLQQFFKFKCWI